jgi:hypothetical protein
MRRLAAIRLDKEITQPTDLYFIETECPERHIKIGIAGNVRARMGKMQMDCPYRLRLIKRVPGAADQEFTLHQRFATDRITGEWFRRSDELLAVIAEFDGLDYLEPTQLEKFLRVHKLAALAPPPPVEPQE